MLVVLRTATSCALSILLSASFISARLIAQDSPAGLPNAGAAKALTDSAIEIESRQYPVAQILARAQKEIGLDPDKARLWLAEKLADRLSASHGQASGGSLGAVGDIALNSVGRGCKIESGTATVICEAEVHSAIEAYLRTIKEFGFRQIVIRTRVLRGPSEVILNKLPIDWEHVPTNSPFATDSARMKFTNGLTTEGTRSPPVVSAGYLENGSEAVRPTTTARPQDEDILEAVSFVERSNPVFFSMLGDEQARAFVKAASVEPEVDLVMSPSVVVYDGQEGTVGNGVQRPFVVGIQRNVAANSATHTVTFQPKVKVYSEGTHLRLRPEMSGDNIRLNCQLDIRKIRKVETFQMPRFDGAGVFQVQIPEVATTRFNANHALPRGFSMVVATLETDEAGKRSALVVMCQCSALELEKKEK